MNKDEEEILALPEPEETDAVKRRQAKQKAEIVEQLKKIPIIQVACERIGIGRATYYRWKKEDKEFAEQAEDAIKNGSALVNDMAEAQLISSIRERELGAITFWLKHRHSAYSSKLEVIAKLEKTEILTPEQEQLVRKALELAALGDKHENAE
ncbi:MAG: hypothetical protein A3A83_03330 [Candidatus Doudnabacteria bacterium RIFCSPLOWO2_01_FULL_48_57]|nr:MAG: hypothetical protein A2668_00745 [Candidatus Doudnabacteria bacterium RIFCSPHIGHO2_01_FULL_48_180]OGE98175.1 MAG: hypothetical protein A3A83_03330 [Candidatus Doudnabacteria bacterium RIFCSPLOWO2_01_FULL_48_57]